MFKTYKRYKNGGKVLIHPEVDRKQSDYSDLLTIANIFAIEGNVVKLTPSVHFKSEIYKEIYGSLIGTPYERKCPDLLIGEFFYEYESYLPPFKIKKISNMIRKGAEQASRIFIDNNKGCSDRYILTNIYNRFRNKNFRNSIDELWLYEKGKIRLIYKKK